MNFTSIFSWIFKARDLLYNKTDGLIIFATSFTLSYVQTLNFDLKNLRV